MDPTGAAAQQEDRADTAAAAADAAADGKSSDDAVAKSASGLTHTDRTTQSDCSMPGQSLRPKAKLLCWTLFQPVMLSALACQAG